MSNWEEILHTASGLGTSLAYSVATGSPVEHPIYTATLFAVVAISDGFEPTEQWCAALASIEPSIEDYWSPRALPSGIAEVFAQRLAHTTGVRVPKVTLSDTEPVTFGSYVKRVAGGWITSERVPQSLPVYFLREQCETLPPEQFLNGIEMDGDDDDARDTMRLQYLSLIDKRCPHDRAAYHDFPEIATDHALVAARWDSPARLRGHAFRAFLHATYAHSSNYLVDVAGQGWVIDFEKILYRDDCEDIRALRETVNSSPRALKECRRINQLSERDIVRGLAGFQKRYWQKPASGEGGAVLSNEKAATDYFIKRLKVWRECFSTKALSNHSQIIESGLHSSRSTHQRASRHVTA